MLRKATHRELRVRGFRLRIKREATAFIGVIVAATPACDSGAPSRRPSLPAPPKTPVTPLPQDGDGGITGAPTAAKSEGSPPKGGVVDEGSGSSVTLGPGTPRAGTPLGGSPAPGAIVPAVAGSPTLPAASPSAIALLVQEINIAVLPLGPGFGLVNRPCEATISVPVRDSGASSLFPTAVLLGGSILQPNGQIIALNENTVTWTSAAPEIAAVGREGRVWAVSKAGSVVVTATSIGHRVGGDKATASCRIAVTTVGQVGLSIE